MELIEEIFGTIQVNLVEELKVLGLGFAPSRFVFDDEIDERLIKIIKWRQI